MGACCASICTRWQESIASFHRRSGATGQVFGGDWRCSEMGLMNVLRALFLALVAVVLLFAGLGMLARPRTVQAWFLGRDKPVSWNPFAEFMRSAGYLVNVRVCGAICVLMAATILWALVAGY